MGYTVALTGGIGSGKSTVADAFARFGVDIVDADVIARQVVEPGSVALQAIAEHFGSDILTPEGSLNRRVLRERIFASPAEKTWLNGLLHPLIHQQTQRQDGDKTGQKHGAKGRMRFQEADIEQSGLFFHYNALRQSFLSIPGRAW